MTVFNFICAIIQGTKPALNEHESDQTIHMAILVAKIENLEDQNKELQKKQEVHNGFSVIKKFVLKFR
jgi:hypothetical protein